MIVTVNTDASYSDKYKRGTYAFWIVCNEFRMQSSGALKNPLGRSEMAEFQCIINALHFLFSVPTKRQITKIFLNTDCLNVIHLVNDDKAAINKYKLEGWGKSLVNKYKKTIKAYGIITEQVEFRHVKAHVEIDSSRSYVNDWLDKAAKKEMGDLLLTLKTKENAVKNFNPNRRVPLRRSNFPTPRNKRR